MGMHRSLPQKEEQVLMLGLDGSGKTTLLYKLKYNESVVTAPTVGFNVESLETSGSGPGLTVWDVGGQRKMRPHWKHHVDDTAGLMFVVDSGDEMRLDEARKELHRVIQSTLNVQFFFSNKLDLYRQWKCLKMQLSGRRGDTVCGCIKTIFYIVNYCFAILSRMNLLFML